MRNHKRFLQRHCRPVKEMTLKEIKSIYNCLPTLITLFDKAPDVKDFIKFKISNSDDRYTSLDKIELNVINLRNKTIKKIIAQVTVCFEKKWDKYYPAHVYRINFDTSILIHSRPLDESFFEK